MPEMSDERIVALSLHGFRFLLASLLLVAHCTMVRRHQRWRKSQTGYPRFARLSFMGYAVWFVILAVIGAWSLPQFGRPVPVGNALTSVSSHWERVRGQFDRVFDSIPSKKPLSEPIYVAPDEPALYFGGPVNLTDQAIFTVRSDVPRYWRIRSYYIYTTQGWLSSQTVQLPLDESGSPLKGESLLRRTPVAHTLRLQVFSPFFFSAGEPLSVDLPAVAEVRSGATAADGASQAVVPSSPESSHDGGGDTQGNMVAGQTQGYASPERPGPDDVVLFSPQVKWLLRPFQEYTIVSSLSEASPEELRNAGEGYPGWVFTGYLGLPSELPARIGILSQEITGEKGNPYDRVQAVRDYLLQIRYSQDIDAPPQGADGVDYFLFEQQAGYCQYFASAMVVMLRSIGIPSRLVAGYLGGDPDTQKGVYTIRERHSHAWAEVYFPNYGWVEFDPTPAGEQTAAEPETGQESQETGQAGTTRGVDEAEGVPDYFVTSEEGGPWRGLPSAGTIWVGLIVATGLAAAVGMMTMFSRRRWRQSRLKLSDTAQVYARMCRLASLLRLAPQPQRTPSEYAARLSLALPSHSAVIEQVAQAYNRDQYGPRKALSAREREALEKAWRRLRRALWRHFLRSMVAHLLGVK